MTIGSHLIRNARAFAELCQNHDHYQSLGYEKESHKNSYNTGSEVFTPQISAAVNGQLQYDLTK